MKPITILLLAMGCLLLACRPDEGPTVSFPECEGNDTYGVDAFLVSSTVGMWSFLSTPDGKVVYEQEAPPIFSTTFFIDKEAACEEVYDLSIGQLSQNNYGQGLSRSLYMDQIAAVPDGTGVSMFRSFEPNRLLFYKQAETIEIKHCPPVDLVSLPYALKQFGADNETTFSYEASDSTLAIFTPQGYAGSLDGLLGIRTTHDQAWHGSLINLSLAIVDELDFRNLPPLTSHNISIASEEEVSLIELHLITNESNLRTALLGATEMEELTYLLPADSMPFELEVITTSPAQDYELKRRYDELPLEIDLNNSLLSISNLSINRPTISFDASGADIVRLTSDPAINFEGVNYMNHTYTAPATEGNQTIRLPDLPPSLENAFSNAKDYYDSSLDNGYLELMHYPGINGDYQIFLRKIIGSTLSQDQSLREEYEKLRVKL